MSRLKSLFALICVLLNSCFGLFDSSADTIEGRYNVGWIDVVSSRSISMADTDGGYGGIEIVPQYVYAVGHNEKFIVAKQHPVRDTKGEKIDINETNYFIIDIRKENYYWQKGVYGPMTKKSFDSLSNSLKVGKIKFEMNYPENP